MMKRLFCEQSYKIILIVVLVPLFSLFSTAFVQAAQTGSNAPAAAELDITVTSAAGKSSANIRDRSYNTTVSYSADDTITITAGEPMYGIYIVWGAPTDPWTLEYNNTAKDCGQYGFLHEYIELPEGAESCTIRLTKSEVICDISAYSGGVLPEEVQVWEPACDKADLIVFSTHADDEILFLGGVLATYGGQQQLAVQVVYMTNYWNGLKIREHEKLDGLWASGIRNYPVNGSFDDLYAETLEGAKRVYSYDEVLSFVTGQLRRFKPLVCVTQDLNGEYGHGGHMLLAEAVCEAVENSADSAFEPDSATRYGAWDVPKTYLHLYPENRLTMDLRIPLDQFGGRTAVEVAADAYKKHVSQQWCWFYVSDDYEYSCADFGLYRTTVGADTGNDLMEHVTSYQEQARIAKERAEAEAKAAAEAEAASLAEKASIEAAAQAEATRQSQKSGRLSSVLLAAGVILVAAALTVCVVRYRRSRRNRR